jgi:hypothetical protein
VRLTVLDETFAKQSVDGGIEAERVGLPVGAGEGGLLGGRGAGVSFGVGFQEEPGVDEEALLAEVEGEEQLLAGRDWLGHQS